MAHNTRAKRKFMQEPCQQDDLNGFQHALATQRQKITQEFTRALMELKEHERKMIQELEEQMKQDERKMKQELEEHGREMKQKLEEHEREIKELGTEMKEHEREMKQKLEEHEREIKEHGREMKQKLDEHEGKMMSFREKLDKVEKTLERVEGRVNLYFPPSLAACDAFDYLISLLSWEMRKEVATDINNAGREVIGSGLVFQSWNNVDYRTGIEFLFASWISKTSKGKGKERMETIEEFWRVEGYIGPPLAALFEDVPPRREKKFHESSSNGESSMRRYMEAAETKVAGLLHPGLSAGDIHVAAGLFCFGVRDWPNEEVHKLSLCEPVWESNHTDTGMVNNERILKVPEACLKKALLPPPALKLSSSGILKRLRFVNDLESNFNKLERFFILTRAVTRALLSFMKRQLGVLAGLEVFRLSAVFKNGAWHQVIPGTSLWIVFWHEEFIRVEHRETERAFLITKAGEWTHVDREAAADTSADFFFLTEES